MSWEARFQIHFGVAQSWRKSFEDAKHLDEIEKVLVHTLDASVDLDPVTFQLERHWCQVCTSCLVMQTDVRRIVFGISVRFFFFPKTFQRHTASVLLATTSCGL